VWTVWCETEKQGSGGTGGAGGSRNGSHGGSDCGQGHRRGRGNGGCGPQKTDECRLCGKLHLWACDYRCKAKKEQAYADQEELASLMVMRVSEWRCVVAESVPVTGTGDAAVVFGGHAVAVVSGGNAAAALEIWEKVFMQLGKLEVGCDVSTWIIDTEAMNHMTRSHVVFIDLDTRMR
jgi:hypothetical protein